MRKIITSLTLMSLSLLVNEVVAQPISFDNINKVQAFVNFGSSNAYTDAKFPQSQFVINLGAHYFPYSFISINPSVEFGSLAAGDASSSVAANRQFTNKFTGGNLTLRFFPLKLFLPDSDYRKYINSLYAGGGIGFIYSNVKADPGGNGYIANPEKNGLTYPVEFGINVPIYENPRGNGMTLLNVNYRYYYTNTDYIDGYKPTVDGNKHNDVYSILSFGMVYQFN